MLNRKILNTIVSVLMVISLTLGGTISVSAREAQNTIEASDTSAMPMNEWDETKIPHYYGPWPNWANSPQVLANAVVSITPEAGDPGTGAEATASVDPQTGGVTAVTVTRPGSGYLVPPIVSIEAPGLTFTPAVATAEISPGVLTSIDVVETGFGFDTPAVSITGGNPTIPAEAVASGYVDNLVLVDGGSYTVGSQPIVEFSLPDLPGGTQATGTAVLDDNGAVYEVVLANPGSGYTSAPTVTIWDQALYQLAPTPATVTTTIGISQVDITLGGEGYDSAPVVAINDTVGTPDKGASATAAVAVRGAVTAINVTDSGAGYLTPGIKKFVDTLPGLGPTAANNLGQYIPLAVADTTTYPGSDYYEIGLVQYRMKFHSSLPATLLRGYVQLSTSVVPGSQIPLSNANLDPTAADTPIYLPDGSRAIGVTAPHYLGPTIVANKDKPVRILFRNLLPAGAEGDLFLPVDTTFMGAGEGPDTMMLNPDGTPMDMVMDESSVMDGVRSQHCSHHPKPTDAQGKIQCFTDNRATLHLHGGITPWISDGTPHQWITPADENALYPKGVSVSNVPDMPDPGPGAQTFFYTNQQSARLMFYHDHAWGITRLNVYSGEAAGYVITDEMEQSLLAPGAPLDGLGTGTPLIIQDRTFVPSDAKMAELDPTWDASRWGGEGSLWLPHVYMPAQNPGDPSGMSAFGRWMYGPYFWPPVDAKYPPIPNPYYNRDPEGADGIRGTMDDWGIELAVPCSLDDPTTWQYQSDPFCEPQLIPGTPNDSAGMEAFHDTPIVNGTAYPTTTVAPKTYRFRILNAANDRFWNLSWYVADPRTGTLSEVALNPVELEAAQTDPVVFPTPDEAWSPKGPNWIQIGTEGGFLPAPVVLPAQPTTWITDPTRFDVGIVDQHSLLLGPAERADVVVDFSQFRGKTLILYNDAPAAFPARVPGYDYYTGGPDLSPAGAPTTLPGYGPNTRTIMQVKVSTAAPATAFDRPNTTADRMGALEAAFAHHLDGQGNPAGVFEAGQNPIIVGQAAYNNTYGTNFASGGWCNSPSNPSAKCDGYARISEQGGDLFKFDTLAGPQISIPLEPKAIHDEMNSANFDPFGRMSGNLGLEAPGATPLTQNIILYPYVNPVTEILDARNMPSSLDVTPIAEADGTQIWKITHNGVDTHPIHFHLYDVQVLNRVAWDNIISPPDPNELGWKDTVRINPLQDTYVAVRPIVPKIPFGVPDSKRPLNPMMPLGARGSRNGVNGSEAGFNNTDANGNPITPIINAIVNFGWEYVWLCHILNHEEMDMMRPVSVIVNTGTPDAPILNPVTGIPGGAITLAWTDRSPVTSNPATWGDPKAEIGYRIERATGAGGFVELGTALANATSYIDTTTDEGQTYRYRVVAYNVSGDSEWSNTVTAEPGVALSAGTYDDANAAWTYTGDWQNYNGSGPYLNTLHYSTTVGSSAVVNFTGEQVALRYTQLSDRGVADIYIDGIKVFSLNQNGPGSWQQTWTSAPLTSGVHTLSLVHAAGAVVDIDAIKIVATANILSPGLYDDANLAWSYSTNWYTHSGAGPYADTLHFAFSPGESAQVSFAGEQFTLFYTQLSDRGMVDVYVDNVKVASLDENGPGSWQQKWTSAPLGAGTHTVRFVQVGTAVVDNDAIEIIDTATILPAGVHDDVHTGIAYSTNWYTYAGPGPYADTLHFSISPQESAQFSFVGKQFTLTYTEMSDRGIFDVYVDGVKVGSIDENGPGAWQKTWTSDLYATGTHTVRLVHASGSILDLDAITVIP
jgi:FtsP/CotA-like multicopper oxidase with cupredoxin domain